jgi:hypothetical protein
MEKISSRTYAIAFWILAAVVLSGTISVFLIPPAGAMGETNFFDKSMQDARTAVAEFDRNFPSPPYVTDNPGNRGSYTGRCPIGTGGAPQLILTGLSTGAKCRGACGMDCPPERCKPLGDWPIKVEGGTCTYRNMIECPSHKGCIDHDACYDYCTENAGDDSLVFGHCHGVCNQRCYDEYGMVTCAKWAALPGAISTKVQRFLDYFADPPMDIPLTFSDEPVFTPDAAPTSAPGNQPCDSINPYDCWTMKER